MKFKPNALTFDEGIQRITEANRKASFEFQKRITTSLDRDAKEAFKYLKVLNVPEGFTKYQLPVFLKKPSQLYFSVGSPGTKVPIHSHDEGDGVRIIMQGSIIYEGQELKAGDWMFIPAGERYSFEVGDMGTLMCYCYCCSCA